MTAFRPVQTATQGTIIAMAILFSVLPTGAVGLRLWARRLSGQRLQWSDGLIVCENAVLVVFWSLIIFTHVLVVILAGGLGRNDNNTTKAMSETDIERCEVRDEPPYPLLEYRDKMSHYHPMLTSDVRQGETALQAMFGLAVYLVKLSALALFHELFYNKGSKAVRTVLNVVTYLTVVCTTVAITGTLYISFPARPWCDPTTKITHDQMYKNMINGMFNFTATVVLDFAIFFIPIWQLFPLRLQRRKKRHIMIAFGLGFLACVVALVRTVVWYDTKAKMRILVGYFLLGLEPSVGTIAICIPLFRPIFQRRTRATDGVRMQRLPSRVKSGDSEEGTKSPTTIVASPKTSYLR
ncbi:hypothetical protein PG997_009939 [Apiospora hydei]|uniref:Rhodopsin domain-containing protein n=1 Tax=Apiospora hydei TaxID=1337664 RepID=A0ABR1VY47_9PEZI